MKQSKNKKTPAASKTKQTKKSSNSRSKNNFWEKVAARAVSLPGYGLLFVAWSFLLGLVIIGLYNVVFDSKELDAMNSSGSTSIASSANAAEVALMVVVSLAALSGIAYFTGKAVRWLTARMKVADKNILGFKVVSLTASWLLLTIVGTLAFPEIDYVVLLSGGIAIAVGSLSFVLEKFVLDALKLSSNDSW